MSTPLNISTRWVGVLLTAVCAGSALPVSALPTNSLAQAIQSASAPAQAPLTPKVALERFFTTEPSSFRTEWFAPNFKLQSSNAEVMPGIVYHISQIKSQLGPYKSVEARGKEFVVGLSRGSVPAQIDLNPEGQITRLAFPKIEFSTPVRASLPSAPSGKAYR
jgi:hypothetical protein